MTNLAAFYNKMTSSEDEERAVDVFDLGFSNTSSTVSHNFLMDRLMKYVLGKQTVR